MSVVSTQPDRFGFSVLEYVWDRVWDGPAIVIGFRDQTRITVVEIVQPDLSLGRVAHRQLDEVCRYVKVILPEDEAQHLQVAAESVADKAVGPMQNELSSGAKRIMAARDRRGLLDGR